jgi:hypothetical protein
MTICNDPNLIDSGLEVIDLPIDSTFSDRQLHHRDIAEQMHGVQRLAHAFVETPETVLQELVNAAVELCGADSAGISLEIDPNSSEQAAGSHWQWAATAGQYSRFKEATLSLWPSACRICLERGKPQLFRVSQKYFELRKVDAPVVTDGLLLPWQAGETRGTIWIMAHGRTAAFDSGDCDMMKTLADFAAMAVRHQQQQQALMQQAADSAVASMANHLAHQINNPLQALTNVAYLAAEGKSNGDARSLGRTLSSELKRLSTLVNKLLTLPGRTAL